MNPVPQINRLELISVYMILANKPVPYGYGAKFEGGSDPRDGHRWNPRSTRKLSTPLDTIDNVDCSGIFRGAGYKATEGALILPDGSQAQRGWFEDRAAVPGSGIREIKNHKDAQGRLLGGQNWRDAMTNVGKGRLFAAFIRPHYNGCGPVGHVLWGTQVTPDQDGETLESWGGHGVGSRSWNTPVLVREIYSVFEWLNVK